MPATELAVATRILAYLGVLGEGGRVAVRVGSDVAYVGARAAEPATMTPYDVAALRIVDGFELGGTPPADVARYLEALRSGAGAAADGPDGGLAVAEDLRGLVERAGAMPWDAVEARAAAAGRLIGAYPGGSD